MRHGSDGAKGEFPEPVMAFVNFSVLALGSLLMGLPILLHLLMKQRPRHQLFPALRFLHRRQISNKRQMRLRNWLLLALRLAAIGLLAALLARPSVDSAVLGYWLKAFLLALLASLAVVVSAFAWLQGKSGLLVGALAFVCLLLSGGFVYQTYCALRTESGSGIGDAHAPVAAVLVFDTSPRMGLRYENRTRLDEARVLSRELIKQLPPDSEIAVIDASTNAAAFAFDIGTSVNMVDSLQVMGTEFPLHELVLRGIELVRTRDDKRKEIYVLTELSEQVWQASKYQAVARQLADHADLSLFILDVGVTTPRNLQLGPLALPAESLPRGRPLRVETDVHSLDMEEEVVVEVLVEQPDSTRPVIVDGKVLLPESVQRDRAVVTVSPGGSAPVAFELRGLPVGVHHGRVRITTDDSLAADNTRYFTVDVHDPWPVLLATSEGAVARYVELVLSPYNSRQLKQTWFKCQVTEARQLTDQELSDYAVVALLDPSPLTPAHWQTLSQYVDGGGSLALFLGRNALPRGGSIDDFNGSAEALLPGPLRLQWRTARDEYLFVAPRNLSHPLLAVFRDYETLVPWDAAPILRHWSFGDLKPGSSVVTRFSNDQPAIVESTLGAGRVLTMTTPVSDPRNDANRPAWNYLPTVEQNWPFFVLMRQFFVYLAQNSEHRWNYEVGQVVTIPTGESDGPRASWQLFSPEGDWRNVRNADGHVTVATTNSPGTYRLRTSRPTGQPLGVSVNLPRQATDLQRIDPESLDTVLGTDRYTLARGAEELDRGIGRSRVGRELYPFLMLLIVGALVMEHLMSNRFYAGQAGGSRQAEARRARAA